MKKLLVVIVVFVVLGLGYDKLRGMRLDFKSMKGEIREVARGDITIPITATGVVSALSRHTIKSEASGEVIDILHREGDMVREGDLLIRLNKENEQRSVDRSQADVIRTKATLEKAKLTVLKLETASADQAAFRSARIRANLDQADFNYKKILRLDSEDRAAESEIVSRKSAFDDLTAQLGAAEADEQDVLLSIEAAKEDIKQAEAAYEQAQTTLADAKKRVAETEIHSPVDGMVVQVPTQVGEVIQGGMSTFGSGTVLAIVANVSRLYVQAEVDEADIGSVRELAPEWARPGHTAGGGAEETALAKGTPVVVRVEAFRDDTFTGEIERIHPEPNSTRSSVVTYRVDILLTGENRRKLLLGMQADVEFTAQSATDVVLVPRDAIRRDEHGRLGCYVPKDVPGSEVPDKEFVALRIGLDNGMYAEVLDGLQAGDRVYVKLPRQTRRESDREERS